MLNGASAHAVISVSDLDRAREFYGGTLGLKLVDEVGGLRFATDDGSWFVVYSSQFSAPSGTTVMSFMVDDLELAVKEMREAGITFEEYDLPGLKTVDGIGEVDGERGAWFMDPDGNILAVGQRP